MYVRFTLIASFAVAAAIANCQSPVQRVQSGLAYWSGEPNLQMRLIGTVSQAQRQDVIEVQLLREYGFSTSGIPTERIEIIENINGVLAQRIVADGMTLYSWTPSINQVSSSTYGSYSPQVQEAVSRLGDGLASLATGYSSYPVRFYRDMFFAQGPVFREWMPGGNQQSLVAVGSYNDPVNPSRTYIVSPSVQYALFSKGNPATRSLAFKFESSSGNERMSNAYFTELKKIGSDVRTVDWQIVFSSPPQLPVGSFVFVPPAGARMIAGPKIGSN